MILLDTHVLIWLANEPAKLSRAATDAIRSANRAGGLAISAITVWELSWLATHDRLEMRGTADAVVEEITSRTAILPITARIALLASRFPPSYSNDPCDRLIGGTALAEGIALVTKDRTIRQARQIETIW